MNSNRILLPIAAVALATVAGCAAGVRYDNRYGYNDGYNSNEYAAAGPPVVGAPSDLVVLPGTDIYAAPSINAELYFVDGFWWRPWNGHWYRSHYYDRDWVSYNSSPYFYRSIPHGWRDDYYHNRWNGRPYSYHQVSRDEAVTHWDRWKRDRYWHDDRWATSRDRYRRDNVSSEARYDQRRDGNRTYQDRRDAYAPTVRSRDDGRPQYQREASSPDRYDSHTTYERERVNTGRTVRPVDRVETERREVRPTSHGRVYEQHTAPAVRSTRPASPAGTVHRMEQPTRQAPVVRSETTHHRAAPARQTEQKRHSAAGDDRHGNREKPLEPVF